MSGGNLQRLSQCLVETAPTDVSRASQLASRFGFEGELVLSAVSAGVVRAGGG